MIYSVLIVTVTYVLVSFATMVAVRPGGVDGTVWEWIGTRGPAGDGETGFGEAVNRMIPYGGLLVTLAAGLLANLFLVRWLVELAERVLDRIPLVKSLFQGLKDVARFFARTGDQDLGRPVVVTLPVGDASIAMVGFMMQEHADLPLVEGGDEGQDLVAVYLPMSYQIGGYTLYLERSRVRPLAVGAEQALRSVITGGALTEGASPPDHSGSITPMGRRAGDEIKRSG
ncbi:MAG: DUF502 domain-containing protein, partial [Gammaproteobacteria bacterium]|jgi:uncharacterized membrane protein|nr:DUF502 domain-containing protein [Gammaproteobacteria bacterium]